MSPFEVLTTADGSPTLRPLGGEAMHSLAGARSETDWVYGHAMRTARDAGLAPSLLSIGLGLGYVEASAIAIWGMTPDLAIQSWEARADLRELWQQVLAGADQLANTNPLLEVIVAATGRALPLLRQLYASGRWSLQPALSLDALPEQRFSVIAFDAYSEKSSPDLWTPELIGALLDRASSDRCILATYASKGVLRRELQARGFTVERRPGFAGKRECTLATRGL